MLNPRRVLTRAQLLDHVWNYDFGGDARVLETYISYLRKKVDVERPAADPHRARRRLRAAAAARAEADVAARARCSPSGWSLLAAPGCWSLAAVTYTERALVPGRPRSTSRSADRGPRSSTPSSATPDRAGRRARRPPGARRARARRSRPGRRSCPRTRRRARRGRDGAAPGGPYGSSSRRTYGELRDASGEGVAPRRRRPSASAPRPRPTLPAHVPVGRLITVDSVGSSGLQYRVFAARDADTGAAHDRGPAHATSRRRCTACAASS